MKAIHDVVVITWEWRRQMGAEYKAPIKEILAQIEDGAWPKAKRKEHALVDRIECLLEGYETGWDENRNRGPIYVGSGPWWTKDGYTMTPYTGEDQWRNRVYPEGKRK